MEAFVYFLIFFMGAFIGSFASLAVYRLPLKQDILYTHSYCPNCKEKLTILDLVPIFSYLFLRGKCRHCGKKIRPRYLILEICSGLATLLFVKSVGFDLYNYNANMIINIVFYIIFITTLILIISVYKEHKTIQKNVVVFGLILEIIYLIYSFSVYKFILTILLIAMIILLKNKSDILEFFTVVIYTLFFISPYFGAINLAILLAYTLFKKGNIVFAYGIITVATLIISNFIQ